MATAETLTLTLADADRCLAERMAVAILKGDWAAARAAADLLSETCSDGAVRVPPVRRLSVDAARVRVVLYVNESCSVGPEGYELLSRHVNDWLSAGRPLVLVGIDRVEVYELGG